MKKLKTIFTTALALALLLTSCGGSQDGSDEGSALTVMGKKSDLAKSYMTAIFDMYEKSTGRKLNIVAVEDSEYEDTAVEKFASGDTPDVFLHFHNSDLARFDVEQNFYYLNGESWVGDLTDSALAYCLDADGNLLGLPFWESSVSGCYYNKTILDSMGLRPATTQAEFDTLCQTLTELGMTPICWPADGCSWMMQFALDPIFADDPDLLAAINGNETSYSQIPEVEAAARWVSAAAGRGWFGSDYLRTGWSDISPALSSGSAVMTFIWDTWFYTDFQPGKYTVDDFALMPVFMGTADSGTYEGGNLNMMMVNKNSPKLSEALEFLDFCATSENYNAAFAGISTVSCFKGQTTNIQSPMVTAAAASIAANERVSTAATRVVGYSAEDVAGAIVSLLRGETDPAGCVERMDELRVAEAKKQGAGGF